MWDLSPTSATQHRTEVSLYRIPHPYTKYDRSVGLLIVLANNSV